MAGNMAGPASGNTIIAFTPLAARPSTSEIDFWVLPCPSVWVQLVTLGHRLASLMADAAVIWRQGLAAKPSARASETGFVRRNSAAGFQALRNRCRWRFACTSPTRPEPAPDPPASRRSRQCPGLDFALPSCRLLLLDTFRCYSGGFFPQNGLPG